MPHPNTELITAVKARAERLTEFNYGLRTADDYVKNLQVCVGDEFCWKNLSTRGVSFQDVLTKASRTLTHCNPEMVVEEKGYETIKLDGKELSFERPKNTLMIFKHVLTTTRKDRDGDVLRTKGASPDPEMLLLWQHVHTLPIGKMLTIAEHTENKLTVVSAIVDINDLAHDAAVMVDNKMGRFSHGFRALEYDDLKAEPGDTTPCGFDIKRFEIMEESLVSVPSNADAETEEIILDLVEGKQLTSGLMKSVGRSIREKRSTTVSGGLPEELKGSEKHAEPKPGCSCGAKDAASEGNTAPTETQVDATDTEHSKKDTSSSEGLTGEKSAPRVYSGMLDGSWEKVSDELNSDGREYLVWKEVIPVKTPENYVYSYAYVLGTYPDSAVLCCYIDDNSKDEAEYRYFRVSWSKNQNNEAEFFGEPVEVEINTTIEITAKTANLVTKDKESAKSPAEITACGVNKAMATIVSSSSTEQKSHLIEVLSTLVDQDKKSKEYQAIKKMIAGK